MVTATEKPNHPGDILAKVATPGTALPMGLRKEFSDSLNTLLNGHRQEQFESSDFATLRYLVTQLKAKRTKAVRELSQKLSTARSTLNPWIARPSYQPPGPGFIHPPGWPAYRAPVAAHWFPWVTLSFGPPYSFGDPTPEKASPVADQPPYNSNVALADAPNGVISIASGGGLGYLNGEGPLFSNYPMPERWIGGDMNSVRATIHQFIDLSPFVKGRSMVYAAAQVTIAEQNYTRLIYCFPGLNSSAGMGTIAVVGTIWLTVTLGGLTVKTPIPPSVTGTNFIYIIAHADDNGFFVLDKQSYLTDLTVSAHIPLAVGVDAAVISVAVEALGVRAGDNDPGGGFVGVDIRDASVDPKTMQPKTGAIIDPMLDDALWMNPTPIGVPQIWAVLV